MTGISHQHPSVAGRERPAFVLALTVVGIVLALSPGRHTIPVTD